MVKKYGYTLKAADKSMDCINKKIDNLIEIMKVKESKNENTYLLGYETSSLQGINDMLHMDIEEIENTNNNEDAKEQQIIDLRDIVEELLELKAKSHKEYSEAMKNGDEDDASYCKEMAFYEEIEVVKKITNKDKDQRKGNEYVGTRIYRVYDNWKYINKYFNLDSIHNLGYINQNSIEIRKQFIALKLRSRINFVRNLSTGEQNQLRQSVLETLGELEEQAIAWMEEYGSQSDIINRVTYENIADAMYKEENLVDGLEEVYCNIQDLKKE